MEIGKILKYMNKPEVFEKGTFNFWDDTHISKNLLQAHLDTNWDAASRKGTTIDRTVSWINNSFLKPHSSILDLGCGPGLYAERFAKLGHNVTGIDFSSRSISYAKEHSSQENLEIEYIYENYLKIDYKEMFDLIVLIYCDFGALSNIERNVLLEKIYNALKPGGVFIFDVFTENFKDEVKPGKDWSINKSGFWSGDNHIVLSEVFHYPEEKVFLNQDIIMMESDSFEVCRRYNHYYSEDDIVNLMNEYKFKNPRFFYDVINGNNFTSSNVVFTAVER